MSENPYEAIENALNSRGVMYWVGISSSGIAGPFFFDGTVAGVSFLERLTEKVWPEIAGLPDIDAVIWQQDGAPAQFSLEVRDWLNENFPGRLLGRGGAFDWPPRSPESHTCRFPCLGDCEEYRLYPAIQFAGTVLKESIWNALTTFDCARKFVAQALEDARSASPKMVDSLKIADLEQLHGKAVPFVET